MCCKLNVQLKKKTRQGIIPFFLLNRKLGTFGYKFHLEKNNFDFIFFVLKIMVMINLKEVKLEGRNSHPCFEYTKEFKQQPSFAT